MYLIGDGRSIYVQSHPWLTKPENILDITTIVHVDYQHLKVCDFIMENTRDWNQPMLDGFFDTRDVNAIL